MWTLLSRNPELLAAGVAIGALALLAILSRHKRKRTVGASAEDPPDTIGRYLGAGSALGVLLVAGLGGWAATAELSGAVLAQGTVVVDSKLKKVQHPAGGVIGDIHVKDGDAVKAGDVLIRLDSTVTRANLDTVTKQLDELSVREARLRAELSGAAQIVWPDEIAARKGEPGVAAIMAAERALFDSRSAARGGQRAQLEERIAQLKAQIEGLEGQRQAKAGEVDLAGKELTRLLGLEAARLVPETKMTDSRRELDRLKGDAAQLQSSLAETKGKIAETELQILQLDDDMRTENGKDLRELQGKVAELIERKVSAEDQLRRIDIRAPQAGIVHQLSVHTIGGVIGQGETLMEIVPEDDPLVIEAKVSPNDIDHVRVDQAAFVRLPAFSQRTTPELSGAVSLISADLTRDNTPGSPNPPYYLARITFTPAALAKLGPVKLLPGMPAEVHIETPKRTALSYLVKPLADQIALAFQER